MSRGRSATLVVVLCVLSATASLFLGILSVNFLAIQTFALSNVIGWCGAALSFDSDKVSRAYAFALALVPLAYLLLSASQLVGWPSR
jgi:hypothetical protein